MNKSQFSNAGLTVVALIAGLAITWMDSRPTWDDTGITALSIFATTLMLGALRPQQAWLSALGVGLWIPLLGLIRHGNYAAGLALVFAFAGAYSGVFLMKLLGNKQSNSSSSGR